ncbi:MAG: hypothetical protein ABH873_09395 [Candidatus Firestonebacteria bacterium]
MIKKIIVLVLINIGVAFCSDNFTAKYGRYEIDTDFPGNKQVIVYYALPMRGNRVLPLSASNMVFCAPYVGETEFFKRNFNNYFVKELGCSVFSFEFKYTDEELGNRKKWYYYKESGWHDLALEVQNKLIHDYGLDRRKIIIVGESGGASMGQQMGIYYPDKIEAVAGIGGAFFDEPKVKSDVAWLMINTWGDSTIVKNDEFAKNAGALGMQVLRILTPPVWDKKGDNFHHIPSNLAEKYVFEFVKGILDLRRNNGGKTPIYEKWPVKYSSENKTLYFSSEDFEKTWKKLPHEFIRAMQRTIESDEIVDFPAKGAKKIVLFLQDEKFYSTMLLDNVYYLHELGYDVVTIDIEMDILYDVCKKRIIKTLQYSIEKSKKEGKDLYAVGFWESGLTLLSEVSKLKDPKVKKLFIFNPQKNLYSEAVNDFPSGCECNIYYTKDYWDDKPITGKTWCKEKDLHAKSDFGSYWFDFFKRTLSAEETKKE